MYDQPKKRMIVSLEDYSKGVIKAKAREEAGRVLISMKHMYEPYATCKFTS